MVESDSVLQRAMMLMLDSVASPDLTKTSDVVIGSSSGNAAVGDAPEPLLSIVAPGVIVFSYSTLPSILINLIVSSPPSETEAWPNDWSSTTSGARFAYRSYPNVNGPCSFKRSELMNETIWLNEFDSQGTLNTHQIRRLRQN